MSARYDGVELLHPFYLLGYCLSLGATHSIVPVLSCPNSSGIITVVVLLRSVGCVSLPTLAVPLRPAVIYVAGMMGVLVAKFTETSLMQSDAGSDVQHPIDTRCTAVVRSAPPTVDHEARMAAVRRRRTSSAALTSVAVSSASSAAQTQVERNKIRRTSLPTLLANKIQQPLVVSCL